MDFLVFISIVCIIYAMLMFFDFFFKSCMMLPYLEFLKSSGISVRFFRIVFYTTSFNRYLQKFCSRLPSFYRHSFKLGCYVTLLLFPVALYLLLGSIFSSPSSNEISTGDKTSTGEAARLEILLPGVNLPLNEIGYYIVALLICSVVHELGHGIAAVLDDVSVTGFGMQLMFLVPIAFTEIDSDLMQSAKLWKKLKICSAGIWNNILLAGWCYIMLLLVPILLSPIFVTNEAVFITKIKPKAPVKGENGLYVGDSVTEINSCRVTNQEQWLKCLSESIIHHPAYCISENFVHDNEESIHEIEHGKDGSVVTCCPMNSALNCFENLDEDRLPQYVCLNIRNTVEHSKQYCHKSACAEHTSCLKPVLPNSTTIIHIKRKNRAKDLVYYGHPYDILRYVSVSDHVPKTKFFEPWLGDSITLLLKYITVFSSGLAIVNVVPCYGLDGQLLVNALISNLPSSIGKKKKELISFAINLIGSSALFVAIIKIIYTTFV